MNSELFARYELNPLGCDQEVRKACNIPPNRYYTVSIFPVAGKVRVDSRSREVKAVKISKSNQ